MSEDGSKVLLRIPVEYNPKEGNELTMDMCDGYNATLPAYKRGEYNALAEKYEGEKIVLSYDDGLYPYSYSYNINGANSKFRNLVESFNSGLPENFFISHEYVLECKDVSFWPFEDYNYEQLVMTCELNGKTIRLFPLEFRGLRNNRFSGCKDIDGIFVRKEEFDKAYQERLLDKGNWKNKQYKGIADGDYIMSFYKRKVRFINRSSFSKPTLITVKDWNGTLKDNTVYECIEDILYTLNNGSKPYLGYVFRDPNNQLLLININEINTYNNLENRDRSFILEDDYQASIARAKREEQERLREQERKRAARRQRLINLYGEADANTILQGRVRIGFTKQMCREAWGNPRDVNKTTTAWSVHEQWCYSTGEYLYFDDGILKTIQN